ncbi:acyl-CoA dehydrogenase family protein [Sphingomonas paeninsulae]|nr:acyl-CoA dehydrogenase family protein [Sphingomonas paeninsulae]
MLQLLPDDDQLQIVDAVQRYVRDEFPVSRLRLENEKRRELPRWAEIAELGYLTIALTEALGGAGFSMAEEVLVFREFGRALISPVAVATTVTAHVLAAGERQDQIVAAIAAGTTRAAPAVCTSDGSLLVIDGDRANLVVLRDEQGLSIFERQALRPKGQARSLDDSVGLERAEIVGKPLMVGTAADTRHYQLLIAAMQVGLGEQARDMAVAYGKERIQFGKPIGSFQAIKHRCADMAVASEMAYAQLLFATIAERDGAPGSPFQVHAACLLAGRSAAENSTGAIQVHGGIGFTSEFDSHRFVKRARVLDQLGGDATVHRTALLTASFPA